MRLVLGWVLMLGLLAGASAQQPTAAQLQAFKNLPPETQQQILQRMGAGSRQGTTVGTGVGTGSGTSATRPADTTTQDGALADGLAGIELLPRFAAGDSLILDIKIAKTDKDGRPQQRDQDRATQTTGRAGMLDSGAALLGAFEKFLGDVRAANPYRLSPTGVLVLPNGPAIPLAGLTEDEATIRLNADPALAVYEIEVTRLPVTQPLLPFGYDLFKQAANGLVTPQDGPVPANYVIGPGDSLSVQLVGENGGQYLLEVNRDGAINLPDIGPLVVAGLRFPEARALIEQRVKTQRIGLGASVSMGSLRSIAVFVLGDVERPGSYAVSGIATVTTALYAAGGIKPSGSLRKVQLKRNGALVRNVDLYDLLLAGDSSNDTRLLPGDVVFVPPVGVTVSIEGEVRRPAIYEVPEGAAAADLLYLAGGLLPEADPRTAFIERIDDRRNRTVADLDLSQPAGRQLRVQSGDALRVPRIRDAFENAVRIEGHVHQPRAVTWHAGMRLSDLVPNEADLKPFADTHYVLVRRESGPERRLSVVSADLERALAERGGAADIALESRDVVTVFDLANARDRFIQPLLETLRRQANAASPAPVVSVDGSIKVPGSYPLESGMKVSDLLRAGGGLADSAYAEQAELTRYSVVNGERRDTEVVAVNLRQVMAGDPAGDLVLQPFDHLLVKQVPNWIKQESVFLSGEVRFPGTYAIRRGETLRSLIERAGGLTDLAFGAGSVFTRRDLREREQQQLEQLANRLQSEIATLSLQQAQAVQTASGAGEANAAGQSLLTQLRSTRAVGRLVVDLPAVLRAAPGSAQDVVLKDGDVLAVPRKTQEVTVLGEVQNATSHLYQQSLSRDQYVDLSGGTTRRADRKHIYVVRANGSVAVGRNGFLRSSAASVQPGDTIVVPIDAERMRPLPTWQAVTQILYNIAIAVAAVHSL